MLHLRTAIPLLAAALTVMPAEATTTYYTDASQEASFNAAVAGLTLLDPALTFSSGDLSPGVGLLNASGTGVNFLGFDTSFALNAPLGFTVNSGKLTGTSGELAKITFPATGIYAFGFHLTQVSGSGNWCVDLTGTGCGNNLFSSSSSSVQFFGVVSTAPITSTLFLYPLTGSPAMVLPNFEAFGPASAPAVPEPSTMLLIGLGLVTLPLTRRLRRPLS